MTLWHGVVAYLVLVTFLLCAWALTHERIIEGEEL